MTIRNICPNDYQPIINVLNDWWGGRAMSTMLPKLFFVHFCGTSFIMETDERVLGFLTGFCSQTYPRQAYIHFAGVNPAYRKQGIGRTLYETFFEAVQRVNCHQVHCETAPVNQQSIAYHLAMGFKADPSDSHINGIAYSSNYDGPGEDRVLFVKQLTASKHSATNTENI